MVDTEAPQPSPGEVQLEVAYTGICGTDLHILHGAMDVRVTMPAANFWLYNLDNDKYFAAPPGPESSRGGAGRRSSANGRARLSKNSHIPRL